MTKKIKFFVILFLAVVLCGCGKTDQKDHGGQKLEEVVGQTDPAGFGEVMRDAYFLDEDTIFSAKVPENWHDELFFAGGDLKAGVRFTCIDSESDGFRGTNFFYLTLAGIPDGTDYSKIYEKTSYEFMDGRKGRRYIKEYEDEMWGDYRYHADILVMPGGNYALGGSEERDPHLTVGRYERNQAQIEAFYESILYQERAEWIGREMTGKLTEREGIRIHFCNDNLKLEMVVPEGIVYEGGMTDEYNFSSDRNAFRLRFYLDEEKKNYVDIFSDPTGYFGDWIITDGKYWAGLLDNQELVYYDERKTGGNGENEEEGFWRIKCMFPRHREGAEIYVGEGEEELYELAWAMVKSVQLE